MVDVFKGMVDVFKGMVDVFKVPLYIQKSGKLDSQECF